MQKLFGAVPNASGGVQIISGGAHPYPLHPPENLCLTLRQKTAPSNGRPLIHFRYVFSCGEATQRLFHEQKLKLGKINNLFLTQLTWQCIGGLPGLLLTLREACKQSLSIHGPPGLSDFLTASQCFMSMHNVDLKCSEYDGESDGVYKDENIVVKPIPVKGNHFISDIQWSNHDNILPRTA